jgi:sugar/nucleoside kinase (ribokinase family)
MSHERASGAKPLRAPAVPARFDVVGLGGNAADFLFTVAHHPQADEKMQFGRYSRQGGGRAATAMVTVARLGMRARYLGGVGDDPEGEENLRELMSEGVDVQGVRIRAGAMTQRAFIMVNESTGERTIIWGRSPEIPLGADEITPEMIVPGRLFYTDAHFPPASLKGARIAREAGIPVLADLESMRPGAEDLLPQIDYLVCNSAFPRLATGIEDPAKAIGALEEMSDGAVVVMTRGAAGALARIDGRIESFPGYRVETTDTTGAGDVFHGAFAVAILRGDSIGDSIGTSIAEAIDFSNAAAAMKCRSLGARAGIPRGIDSVEAFRRAATR